MTIYFKNVYVDNYFSVLGRNEHSVSIKADLEINDYYDKQKSVEEGEKSLLLRSIRGCTKGKNVDLCISSDLQNQLFASSFALREEDIPFLGTYSACASFVSNLIIASSFINSGLSNVLVSVSSSNLASEKQFRFPIEYGSIRKRVNAFTATGAVSSLVSSSKSSIRIESATIGKVTDIGYKDANNFGACMALSAAKSIYEHLIDTNRNSSYYDAILTGDLGVYGKDILKDCLRKEYNLEVNNIIDAGSTLFKDSGKDIAGGSGPVCLPLVLFNKILKEGYKKILLVGTGSLHSKNSCLLKESIPSISHIVSLEVIK